MKTQLSTIAALVLFALPLPAYAEIGESSFTPHSLRVPLRGIVLGGNAPGSPMAMIYQCPADMQPTGAGGAPSGGGGSAGAADGGATGGSSVGGSASVVTDPDCLVDMADDAALAAVFSGAMRVPPGTYSSVSIFNCRPGDSGYTSYVEGEVVLGGSTYYTTSGTGEFLTTDPALTQPIAITYGGCASTVALPAPVTIADGDTVEINSFFTLSNIAWGALRPNSMGGCASNDHQSVCTGYPIPVASVGAVSPTLDTYFVTFDVSDTNAAKASGQLLLLRDASGEPFGGFSRRLYSEQSPQPLVNFDTPLKSITKNDPAVGPDAGATYTIMNWGGGMPGAPPSEYYMKYESFVLASHEGSVLRPDGAPPAPYRAVKQ